MQEREHGRRKKVGKKSSKKLARKVSKQSRKELGNKV